MKSSYKDPSFYLSVAYFSNLFYIYSILWGEYQITKYMDLVRF